MLLFVYVNGQVLMDRKYSHVDDPTPVKFSNILKHTAGLAAPAWEEAVTRIGTGKTPKLSALHSYTKVANTLSNLRSRLSRFKAYLRHKRFSKRKATKATNDLKCEEDLEWYIFQILDGLNGTAVADGADESK